MQPYTFNHPEDGGSIFLKNISTLQGVKIQKMTNILKTTAMKP
jgi:hypothetical protein